MFTDHLINFIQYVLSYMRYIWGVVTHIYRMSIINKFKCKQGNHLCNADSTRLSNYSRIFFFYYVFCIFAGA